MIEFAGQGIESPVLALLDDFLYLPEVLYTLILRLADILWAGPIQRRWFVSLESPVRRRALKSESC